MERNFQGKKGSFAHRNFHHLSFLITFFGNIFANSRLWFFQTQCCKLIQKASKIIMPRSQGKFQGPPFPYYSASSHTKSLVAMRVLGGFRGHGNGGPTHLGGDPWRHPWKARSTRPNSEASTLLMLPSWPLSCHRPHGKGLHIIGFKLHLSSFCIISVLSRY